MKIMELVCTYWRKGKAWCSWDHSSAGSVRALMCDTRCLTTIFHFPRWDQKLALYRTWRYWTTNAVDWTRPKGLGKKIFLFFDWRSIHWLLNSILSIHAQRNLGGHHIQRSIYNLTIHPLPYTSLYYWHDIITKDYFCWRHPMSRSLHSHVL